MNNGTTRTVEKYKKAVYSKESRFFKDRDGFRRYVMIVHSQEIDVFGTDVTLPGNSEASASQRPERDYRTCVQCSLFSVRGSAVMKTVHCDTTKCPQKVIV